MSRKQEGQRKNAQVSRVLKLAMALAALGASVGVNVDSASADGPDVCCRALPAVQIKIGSVPESEQIKIGDILEATQFKLDGVLEAAQLKADGGGGEGECLYCIE